MLIFFITNAIKTAYSNNSENFIECMALKVQQTRIHP